MWSRKVQLVTKSAAAIKYTLCVWRTVYLLPAESIFYVDIEAKYGVV